MSEGPGQKNTEYKIYKIITRLLTIQRTKIVNHNAKLETMIICKLIHNTTIHNNTKIS